MTISILIQIPLLVLVSRLTGPLSSSGGHVEPAAVPPSLQRGFPGPGHEAIADLAGTWRVEKSNFMGLGTPEEPATGELISRREWIAGGRFLTDTTVGEVAGTPYFRTGLLGYSNPDQFYEWVTVDATNSNFMVYRGQNPSGPARSFDVVGVFTDPGFFGEDMVGKGIAMRTRFVIESADRHILEISFTPPGGTEILIDRGIYTRMAQDT